MRFVDFTDADTINGWLTARKAKPVGAENWPRVGMIVEGLAAGFLIQTDTPVAFLEHFVTNPAANLSDRRMALSEIALTLERIAREKGFKRVAAITQSVPILKVASSLGYVFLQNVEMVGKEL